MINMKVCRLMRVQAARCSCIQARVHTRAHLRSCVHTHTRTCTHTLMCMYTHTRARAHRIPECAVEWGL